MKLLKFVLFYYLPPLIVMVVIFWLSSIPGIKVTPGPSDAWLRKLAHISEFALLWLLWYRAITGPKWFKDFKSNFSNIILSLFFTILYAASDEIHQLFVPTREGKVTDVMIDSTGPLMTVFVGWLATPKLKNTKVKDSTSEPPMPFWPILLGIVTILGICLCVFFFYQSHCPNI